MPFAERQRIAAEGGPSPVGRIISVAVAGLLALGAAVAASTATAVDLNRGSLLGSPFGAFRARASDHAFGWSGRVRMRVALPNEEVSYPLEVEGTLDSISWSWVRVGSSDANKAARSLTEPLRAPDAPGFYQLALQTADGQRRTFVDGPALAVLVPFSEKRGSTLNGYRIGRYVGERRAGAESPSGFLEVGPGDLDLPVSEHLRVRDFMTHDGSKIWPRYIALDPNLLDKLELVTATISRLRGGLVDAKLSIDVHSGFRTPLHNRRVANAARDSRHQYGDAADIAIDADGNGRINSRDLAIIARAVEEIDRSYPDLRGGLGLYSLGSASYVHIDVRGQSVRWDARSKV
ncbi:MAG: D-Ala-D-Ala carboxypeptidase family metallohydrolase [Gemmatimonadaceae bacterium]